MSFGAIAVGAGVGLLTAGIGAAGKIIAANKNQGIAEDAATKAEAESDIQRAKLEEEKDAYRNMTFENPYENMENVYEDLTVNQQQAQFQAQQGEQQRANIMQGLQASAGGSGIAGLAQAMANQGQLQTQQISASIGQQEARNQTLKAQGANQNQQLERQGEAMVQEAETSRQSTLLGMQMGETQAADEVNMRAQQQKMQADMAKTEAWTTGITDTISGTISGGLGAFGGVGGTVDAFNSWKANK